MSLILFLILFIAVLIIFSFFFALSMRKSSSKIDEIKRSQSENQALSLMQQQIGQLTQNINQQLQNMENVVEKILSDGQALVQLPC